MGAAERRQQILELLCQRRKETVSNLRQSWACARGRSAGTLRRSHSNTPSKLAADDTAAALRWRTGITGIAGD